MFSESLPHLGGGKITDGIQFCSRLLQCFFPSCIVDFQKSRSSDLSRLVASLHV